MNHLYFLFHTILTKPTGEILIRQNLECETLAVKEQKMGILVYRQTKILTL
jgi:hypothetical protein